MGMNVGTESGDDEVVSAINTTPLVDVMLVLLIIFLITIPVAIHTVPVTLPSEEIKANETKPENINISVTKDGDVYWNQVLIPDQEALVAKLKEESPKIPQPEVQIRGDQGARYEFVGRVVVACQRAGIVKVGFITEPPPKG
ncbi:biopolymer transporter ExbD [Chitinimonas sp. BJYL2]|uniref:ExbD/TolR family protein n=1 Tax=Chitinimonas sp. BJYL2 TaxID=2976696 RepID=UPI0022B3AEA9|nr:biopolymer transporter ExbD [Chitinimonas sp. BJYL2]